MLHTRLNFSSLLVVPLVIEFSANFPSAGLRLKSREFSFLNVCLVELLIVSNDISGATSPEPMSSSRFSTNCVSIRISFLLCSALASLIIFRQPLLLDSSNKSDWPILGILVVGSEVSESSDFVSFEVLSSAVPFFSSS